MAVTRLTTNGLSGTKYDIASADNYYMEPIATTLLTSTASSVTFSNIPAGYKHLQIRNLSQTNRATYGFDDIRLRFNSDSGTNYSRHYLGGDGSSAYAGAALGVSASYLYIDSGAGTTTAGTNFFGASIIDILDYANTSKYKTTRALCGADVNGTVGGIGGRVTFNSGLWMNTAPITSITIFPDASLFSANSRFSLYGIKG